MQELLELFKLRNVLIAALYNNYIWSTMESSVVFSTFIASLLLLFVSNCKWFWVAIRCSFVCVYRYIYHKTSTLFYLKVLQSILSDMYKIENVPRISLCTHFSERESFWTTRNTLRKRQQKQNFLLCANNWSQGRTFEWTR